MAKKNEITVKDVTIKTMNINGIDYICITDIARQKNAIDSNGVFFLSGRYGGTFVYSDYNHQNTNLIYTI